MQSERRPWGRWTPDKLAEIAAALATLKTNELGRVLGINPKTLRSALRRNGISLRDMRDRSKQKSGLVVRRSRSAPAATYGAAALEKLPNDACRWSLGDPAEPNFTFCGAPVAGRSPYCEAHQKAGSR